MKGRLTLILAFLEIALYGAFPVFSFPKDSLATARRQICCRLLGGLTADDLRSRIIADIERRTGFLRANPPQPFVINEFRRGPKQNVAYSIERQFAPRVIDETTQAIKHLIRTLELSWVAANREENDLHARRRSERVSQITAELLDKSHLPKERENLLRRELKDLQPHHTPNGVPIAPLFQRFPSEAKERFKDLFAKYRAERERVIREHLWDPLSDDYYVLKVPHAPSLGELQRQFADFLIRRVIDRWLKKPPPDRDGFQHPALLFERLNPILKRLEDDYGRGPHTTFWARSTGFAARRIGLTLASLAPNRGAAIFDRLSERSDRGNPELRWTHLQLELDRIVEEIKQELRTISSPDPSIIKAAKSAQGFRAELPLDSIRARLNNGTVELVVPQIGRMYYDVELGTTVLTPIEELPLERPIIVLFHGDGTNISNAASWQAILARLVKAGLNPISITLPVSGPSPTIGMNIRGIIDTSAWLNYVMEVIRRRNGDRAMIAPLGRSSGSSKEVFRDILYSVLKIGESAPDRSTHMSYSNIDTATRQLRSLYWQHEQGLVKRLEPEALQNYLAYTAEARKLLNLLQEKAPGLLSTYGDHMLFLQGDSDLDSGPQAVEEGLAVRDKHWPFAHIYVFHNPLNDRARFPQLYDTNGMRIGISEEEEGHHCLMSGRSKMTRKEWEEKHKGIPIDDIDLPNPADQTNEAIAVWYGHEDYLIDLSPLRSTTGRAYSERQREKRRRLMISENLPPNTTYLQRLRILLKISEADYSTAIPGRKDLANRIKKVEEFWTVESERIRQLIEGNRGVPKEAALPIAG